MSGMRPQVCRSISSQVPKIPRPFPHRAENAQVALVAFGPSRPSLAFAGFQTRVRSDLAVSFEVWLSSGFLITFSRLSWLSVCPPFLHGWRQRPGVAVCSLRQKSPSGITSRTNFASQPPPTSHAKGSSCSELTTLTTRRGKYLGFSRTDLTLGTKTPM
jgi:hypothetical protein